MDLAQLKKSDINALKDLEELIDHSIEIIPSHYEEGLEVSDVGIWTIQTRVSALIIENKGIVQLPDSIGNLTGLSKLYLSSNRMETLPTTIGKLRSLKELVLSKNKFKNLPKQLIELPRLNLLNLAKNPLPDNFAKIFGPKYYRLGEGFDNSMRNFYSLARKYFENQSNTI